MSTFLSTSASNDGRSNDGRPATPSSIDTDLHSQPGHGASIVSSSGPVGEPGLPPSRQTDSARNSRRGFAAFGARPRSSRPESAANSTHIPLASSNFFRPMSSQKLQAQRGQTVIPQAINEERADGLKKTKTRSHRNSDASVHTMRGAGRKDEEAPPLPVSRGGYSIATSAGGAPIGGSVDSTAPLDLRSPQQREMDEKAAQKKRLGLGTGPRHSTLMDVHDTQRLASRPNSTTTTQEKPPYLNSADTTGRNYEYFGGNMLFFFLGRCLNTRAKPLNILTLILAVFPAVLFFLFSAPYLWRNTTPAVPIIFAYIFLLTLSSFLHAAFSDPGILPRNLHPHPELQSDKDPLAIGPPSTEWVMVKTFPSTQQKINPESSAEQGQHTTAMEVPTKFCKTCQIWRPPRTHHCRICDACMETQDHHCVWLNNCVGRRNYRYFFAFVGMGSIMALLLVAFSAIHIQMYASAQGISFGSALTGRTQEKVAFAMLVYALFALPYPGSLFVYHLFLVGRGETTREYLNGHKFLPVDRHRPFSLGTQWKNWTAVLLRPRTPSYMSFKKKYQEGDVRLGHGTRRKDRRQQEKREAIEQKSRVEGLKQRFTVGNGSSAGDKNGEGEKQAVEMKSMNGGASQGPPNTANGGGNGRPALGGRLNSTPRIGVGGMEKMN